jgi:GLPGLI family protein
MKSIIFLIASIFIPICGYMQEVTGVIKYKFMYSDESSSQNALSSGVTKSYTEVPSYLYFNAQKSLFDYDKEEYNKELPYKRKQDKYGQMYFMDKTKGELYIREFIYHQKYITHEKIPVIPWQLKNEVKTIAGYVCKKAEATFRGRKYTAWYTSSIPVSVGPWKLQGLPGAILEAESADGEVKFMVESIRIPAYVERQLNPQELPDGKIVSYQEYLDAFEKERKIAEQQMRNLFSTLLEEEVKKGDLKIDPKTASEGLSVKKVKFRLEKYE